MNIIELYKSVSVCLTLPSFASHLCEQLAFADCKLTSSWRSSMNTHTTNTAQATARLRIHPCRHCDMCYVLYTHMCTGRVRSFCVFASVYDGDDYTVLEAGTSNRSTRTAESIILLVRCIEQMCSSEFSTKYAHSFPKWTHTYVTVFVIGTFQLIQRARALWFLRTGWMLMAMGVVPVHAYSAYLLISYVNKHKMPQDVLMYWPDFTEASAMNLRNINKWAEQSFILS